ncbi:GDSL-type esterase/lipase family protein [Mesorhizobium sp. M2A.F.Ca.ET.046.03.2.1]|uniref:GDSL-type esterase/lipase family protein n=1 Tax=Mesorhizobium sp. M2A.F.Ca.ET.046.03.2.1 TaxID=2493674 RepID=UPI001FE1C865|nr:GDSL-type esterase/lipase family protein [Mesorhizobium sp. M2A.F.Ca.ET.046.03.2.1]
MQRLLALLTWLAFPVYVWQGLGVRRRTTRMLPARGPVLHEIPGKAPSVALLVLGDSSAASVGIEQSERGLAARLAGLIAERTGRAVRWRAAGFNSATSGQIRDHVLPNLSADPWTHIVLAIGTNDTKNSLAARRAAAYALRANGGSAVSGRRWPGTDAGFASDGFHASEAGYAPGPSICWISSWVTALRYVEIQVRASRELRLPRSQAVGA